MYICPVCGSRHDAACCGVCGFDESRNYERYPTLSAPAEPVDAISRRVQAWAAYYRCSACGGTQFMADLQKAQLVCATCRQTAEASALFQTALQKQNRGDSGGAVSQPQNVPQRGALFADEKVLQEEHPTLRQMQQAHAYWSGRVSAAREELPSQAPAPQTPARDIANNTNWRKSEAAHREWLKSQGKQPASPPQEPAGGWHKSEAEHREWLKTQEKQPASPPQEPAGDWRKSEAAHREWLKSQEKQPVSRPQEPAGDWRKSEAAHREWLKGLRDTFE